MINYQDRIKDILQFWFGAAEEAVLPSAHRTQLWFGHDDATKAEIKAKFLTDWEKASTGEYNNWQEDPHAMLALIIIYDQFSRLLFPNSPQSYSQDQVALDLCMKGIQKEYDHTLSLIERVFFYFPLTHSENLEMQATAVRAYQILVNLSFAETRSVYEKFLDYAIKQYEIVRRYGRFPQRNIILGRPSTAEELEFLKNSSMTE